jgi:hypothetical protein
MSWKSRPSFRSAGQWILSDAVTGLRARIPDDDSAHSSCLQELEDHRAKRHELAFCCDYTAADPTVIFKKIHLQSRSRLISKISNS